MLTLDNVSSVVYLKCVPLFALIYFVCNSGSQPFGTGVAPNKNKTPLRTPKIKVEPFLRISKSNVYPQISFLQINNKKIGLF